MPCLRAAAMASWHTPPPASARGLMHRSENSLAHCTSCTDCPSGSASSHAISVSIVQLLNLLREVCRDRWQQNSKENQLQNCSRIATHKTHRRCYMPERCHALQRRRHHFSWSPPSRYRLKVTLNRSNDPLKRSS